MSTIVIKKNLQRVGYAKADKYITSPVRYSTISTEDLLKYASQNSGIPKAQMMAAFYAINQQVEQFILNGHALQLGTLGYFFLSVKTKATDTEEDAGVDAVKKLALKFRQSKQMAVMISQNVQFDCLNKKEEEDNENVNGNENGDTNGDTGNDNGGTGGEESNPL